MLRNCKEIGIKSVQSQALDIVSVEKNNILKIITKIGLNIIIKKI